MKVDAYRCDGCKQIFTDALLPKYTPPKGLTIFLSTTKYGDGDTKWELEHCCANCRKAVDEFALKLFGAPTSETLPIPGAPQPVATTAKAEEPF